ncbi:unnamed protein product [Pleuronectes platessa]|uniref:Uncharacterized protein n=1 Tax=Pleuronectes platessa TaxID=8262 RepID=A0A9N7UJN9_PLEPL|nr:unnamed protein product [Pleuronectes platessa]
MQSASSHSESPAARREKIGPGKAEPPAIALETGESKQENPQLLKVCVHEELCKGDNHTTPRLSSSATTNLPLHTIRSPDPSIILSLLQLSITARAHTNSKLLQAHWKDRSSNEFREQLNSEEFGDVVTTAFILNDNTPEAISAKSSYHHRITEVATPSSL